MKISQTIAAGTPQATTAVANSGKNDRVPRTGGWTLYDPRLAWMLVAPVVFLLIIFLVLPIAVMAVYTFFTFVLPVWKLAR
ncbi:hypothetical protein [Rhizobium mongolense]|uniref:hypothetical protein n=1 Tax=Rhizobium mongolense TaxID=57676 RepID=UPI0034A289D9